MDIDSLFTTFLAVIGLFVLVDWGIGRVVAGEMALRKYFRCRKGTHSFPYSTSRTCEVCGCPRYLPLMLGDRQSN